MNSEILQILKTRRSIRAYKSAQISEELLNAILETGTYAPTAKGLQSPLIVAVQDGNTIAQLSRMNREILGSTFDPYYGAPTILLVFADGNIPTHVEDGSCVLLQMMLAAHALGLGTCWINRERQMFESADGKTLLRQWGVSDNFKGIGALSLGYPDGPAAMPAARKQGYYIKI